MPPSETSASGRARALLGEWLTVAVLLACHLGLGLSAVGQKAMTFDEGIHLTGGFHYWALGDFRLHPENGNLSQRFTSFPLWLAGFHEPSRDGRGWSDANHWEMGDRFFYESDNDADTMLWRGRLMMALPSTALALLVYAWSRSLSGVYGGLISLTLYAFSPTMLANGFLTTSDLFAALFFTAAVGALARVLEHVSPGRVAASSLAIAGLMLSKYSGVLILPMALVLLTARLIRGVPLTLTFGRRQRIVTGRTKQLAVFTGVALVEIVVVIGAIWAAYNFRYTAFAPGYDENAAFLNPWPAIESRTTLRERPIAFALHDTRLLPEAYAHGLCWVLFGRDTLYGFLCGKFQSGGHTLFFPFVFAVKTQPELLLMLVLAGCALWTYRRGSTNAQRTPAVETDRPRGYQFIPLLAQILVYGAAAVTSRWNLGHRHLLPIYPPLFILSGAASLWLMSPPLRTKKREKNQRPLAAQSGVGHRALQFARAAIVCGLVLAPIEALITWPNYLAYFSPVIGGPRRAYELLVDSSLDWGQDLNGVRQWLDAHPEVARDPQHTYLSYFGVARQEYYGIEAEPLPGFRPRWAPHAPQPLAGGVYFISATTFQTMQLLCPGRWNELYERDYQRLKGSIEAKVRAGATYADLRARDRQMTDNQFQSMLVLWENFRFCRLLSFLHRRQPDDVIGHSILVYRLSDADIADALEGPPCELLKKPEL